MNQAQAWSRRWWPSLDSLLSWQREIGARSDRTERFAVAYEPTLPSLEIALPLSSRPARIVSWLHCRADIDTLARSRRDESQA